MFEEEYLFFSAQRSFRKQPDEIGRTDPAEGNLAVHTFTSCKIVLPSGGTLDASSGQVVEFLEKDHKLLCSLYCPELDSNYQIVNFDDRMLALGPSAMVIHDIPNFFALVFDSLEQLGLEYSSRRATYFDSQSFNGEISVHHKDIEYAYQREQRIMTWRPDAEFLRLPLPGMRNFVRIIDSGDVPYLKISVNS
ncbi:MAG: hypothetical protein ACO1N1_24750 [Dyadobacter fermentans]